VAATVRHAKKRRRQGSCGEQSLAYADAEPEAGREADAKADVEAEEDSNGKED
jgi:hypothetical protein